MPRITSHSLFAAILFSTAVNAQIVARRRRVSIGRIIAGSVAGGLFILILLASFCCMRRRRINRFRAHTIPAPTSSGNKPYPGGSSATGAQTGYGPPAGSPPVTYGGYSSGQNDYPPQHTYPSYNPEHLSSNAPVAPPPYQNSSDVAYKPPSMPPPVHGQSNHNNGNFSPTGEPPSNYGTGRNNDFVGGFRS